MKKHILSLWRALKQSWKRTPRPCPKMPTTSADWYNRALMIADLNPGPNSCLWEVHDALMKEAFRAQAREQALVFIA
jgi:hypothetical protein